jgi:hypothetical protein
MQRIEMARSGRFSESLDLQFPLVVTRSTSKTRNCAKPIATWQSSAGPEAFVRHLQVDISRPDSRPVLVEIRCPTTVVVGDASSPTRRPNTA